MLESAYSLNQKHFYLNIVPILLYAILVSNQCVERVKILISTDFVVHFQYSTFTIVRMLKCDNPIEINLLFLFILSFLLLFTLIKGTMINIAMIGPSLYVMTQVISGGHNWLNIPPCSVLELTIFGASLSAIDPVSVCILHSKF